MSKTTKSGFAYCASRKPFHRTRTNYRPSTPPSPIGRGVGGEGLGVGAGSRGWGSGVGGEGQRATVQYQRVLFRTISSNSKSSSTKLCASGTDE
ncbi:MAG: hypothetical protein DCC52_13960 [Chloroflexi bacterium]|nr:MAG: hypothetical protein DCC52_13960 [Chloroflexota bacterium]